MHSGVLYGNISNSSETWNRANHLQTIRVCRLRSVWRYSFGIQNQLHIFYHAVFNCSGYKLLDGAIEIEKEKVVLVGRGRTEKHDS